MGEIIGAFVPTFLISRLLWWLLKRWDDTTPTLIIAHLLSAVLLCILSAFGHANGGSLDWSSSWLYIAVQGVWLVFDFVRIRRKVRQRQRAPRE